MVQRRFLESQPPPGRIAFDTVHLGASGTGTVTLRIPDDCMWMGLGGSSTHANFVLRIYDENANEYLPVGGRYVYRDAWAGNGQRPFWFPIPRLLRRGQNLRLDLIEMSAVACDVWICLYVALVCKDVVKDWECQDIGYLCYANDTVGHNTYLIHTAALGRQTVQVALVQNFDFALGSLTGFITSVGASPERSLDAKFYDPGGCARDPSIVVAGYQMDTTLVPYEILVGTAQYSHWLTTPYYQMSEAPLTVDLANRNAVNCIDIGLMWHGGKVARGNEALMRRTVDWMSRMAMFSKR